LLSFSFPTGPSHRAVGRREERGLKKRGYGVGAPKRPGEVARHAVVLKVVVENRIPNVISDSASAILKLVIHATVEKENFTGDQAHLSHARLWVSSSVRIFAKERSLDL